MPRGATFLANYRHWSEAELSLLVEFAQNTQLVTGTWEEIADRMTEAADMRKITHRKFTKNICYAKYNRLEKEGYFGVEQPAKDMQEERLKALRAIEWPPTTEQRDGAGGELSGGK